jgi:DNA-binding CsgD family transcriptional regulator
MASRTWEQYEMYILQNWPLTHREVQVALECIKGKRNKEIAAELGIGAETVNKTLDHVYRATGVNGRDQLVAKLLIADIDNTPLQQTLTLAGEGAALVGAGFLATLYASRAERKRPRSLRTAALPSKSQPDRSESAGPAAATQSPQSQGLGAAEGAIGSAASASAVGGWADVTERHGRPTLDDRRRPADGIEYRRK